MNTADYSAWLERAFLFAQAAVAQELGNQFREAMSEERLRIEFLRGLVAALPAHAHRVKKEREVPWNGAVCVSHGQHISGGGRPLAHDVKIDAEGGPSGDGGAYVEIKWVKKDEGSALAQDILKLALTRGVDRPKDATRTYLLVGGAQEAFASSLKSLGSLGATLRWSPAGRGDAWPKPTRVVIGKMVPETTTVLRRLLTKGPKHLRLPPQTRWELKATLRERWMARLALANEKGWRLALWELHSWGNGTDEIDWGPTLSTLGIGCAAG